MDESISSKEVQALYQFVSMVESMPEIHAHWYQSESGMLSDSELRELSIKLENLGGNPKEVIAEKQSRLDWEREIIDGLSDRLEISNGDAQGIFEAHPFEAAQEWTKGSCATMATERLINL